MTKISQLIIDSFVKNMSYYSNMQKEIKDNIFNITKNNSREYYNKQLNNCDEKIIECIERFKKRTNINKT